MNYIEELIPGDVFDYKENKFILTIDFKRDNSKLGVNLSTGIPKWFASSEIINKSAVYYLDSDNNIVAIKQDKNQHETHTNIS